MTPPAKSCPIDPADPQFSANPFPQYDTLRAVGSFAEVELPNGRTAWFVTSADLARRVLMDERFSAKPPVKDRQVERAGLEGHMLNTDAPAHTRLRRLVAGTFSNARVDALSPRIKELADELLDEICQHIGSDAGVNPTVDIVNEYAFPLPVAVMCEVLGVPRRDRHRLRGWTYTVSAPKAATGEAAQAEAWTNLHDYFAELIDSKRRNPQEDLFSHLANAEDEGGALTSQELLPMAFLLLFAGYETTMNLVAGGVLTLSTHQPQLRTCMADTTGSTWEHAVEELLRFVSPLEGATWRFARTDVAIEGAVVPEGSSVLVSLAAANHDPQQHVSPHQFDIGRTPNRHIAFGHGPHHCVGARLARIETQIALSRLYDRFPDLRLVDDVEQIPWRPGLLVRGPQQLHVRVSDPLTRIKQQGNARRSAGMQRELSYRRSDDSVLDLASNDYLGLSRHPDVVAAAQRALETWGAGSTGSRLVTGSVNAHRELEESLADHLGTESALVFSSGYLANLGTVTALADKDDLIVSDSTNHASLIDACRLSRARIEVAPHCDADAFEKILTERSEVSALAVTDSVFSVDGERAPLGRLASAARRADALLIVDEAHGLGVIGQRGEGVVAGVGLAGASDIIVTATLSKSLASQGGLVAGSSAVIEHIINSARPFIFDTGLAPASAAAALAALRQLQAHPELAEMTRANACRIAAIAQQSGLAISQPDAAVCSVLIGDPMSAVAARELCLSMGIRVGCFRPPSVSDGVSRIRLTARANLSEADFTLVEAALRAVATRLPGTRP